MYPVATTIDSRVAGMPTLRNCTNPIGRPERAAMPAAATFAAAATSVALPPKHAPDGRLDGLVDVQQGRGGQDEL